MANAQIWAFARAGGRARSTFSNLETRWKFWARARSALERAQQMNDQQKLQNYIKNDKFFLCMQIWITFLLYIASKATIKRILRRVRTSQSQYEQEPIVKFQIFQ